MAETPEPLETPDLRTRINIAIADASHRAIHFTDLDEVPPGSSGYLSPTGARAGRLADGRWTVSGQLASAELMSHGNVTFTSQSGPANDAKLAELLEQALVPKDHLLVDFEVDTEHEPADWEGSQPAYDYSFMTNPQIVAHRLADSDLAGLYFEAEAGMLGESDVYSYLSKRIEDLGEDAAMTIRDKAAANRHEWLQLDIHN